MKKVLLVIFFLKLSYSASSQLNRIVDTSFIKSFIKDYYFDSSSLDVIKNKYLFNPPLINTKEDSAFMAISELNRKIWRGEYKHISLSQIEVKPFIKLDENQKEVWVSKKTIRRLVCILYNQKAIAYILVKKKKIEFFSYFFKGESNGKKYLYFLKT